MKTCKIQIAEEELTFYGHDDSYLDYLAVGKESNFDEYSKELIPPNATILDIGANIGFVSALFSIHNPNSVIYSLEPGAENFKYLTKNIEINHLSNVHPLKIAASFENSSGSFNEHSAWGYLESKENHMLGGEIVEVMTIDSLVLKLNLQTVDLIKIDVEGFEGQVFEGMKDTLKRFNPKVIFEFNSFCMLAYGRRNPLDFLEYIDKIFTNVSRFTHGSIKDGLTFPMSRQNFGVAELHENIVSHASVDDFLVWN